MEKLIDDIIELILGDMDCHHEVDHDEDGTHLSVEYNLNNETKLREMIRELIRKPKVTEEWIRDFIREKTDELMEIIDDPHMVLGRKLLKVDDFIRSLVEKNRLWRSDE